MTGTRLSVAFLVVAAIYFGVHTVAFVLGVSPDEAIGAIVQHGTTIIVGSLMALGVYLQLTRKRDNG